MTQEEKRIAIAAACPTVFRVKDRCVMWHICHQNAGQYVDLFNDLNAMHEAEKTLTAEERRQFAMMLNTIHPTADIFYPDATTRSWASDLCAEVFELVSATAAQRAEAFGRVKGLWE